MKNSSSEKEPRTRKWHTRSRTGCLTCRKRHIRCDGERPSCTQCTTSGRTCEVVSPKLPLRDRRAMWLPGEQQPWVVDSSSSRSPSPPEIVPYSKPLDVYTIDPLDCLAFQMPYRSKELLHYFRGASHNLDIVPKLRGLDPLTLLSQHTGVLRNTLLVAGIHYAWTVGDAKKFEETLLFHKVETIQLLNQWIDKSQIKDIPSFFRHITTLCLSEACLGNISAAEAHLCGIVTAMDIFTPLSLDLDTELSLEDEIVHRYLISMYISVYGLKSRIQGSATLCEIFGTSKTAQFSDLMSIIYEWNIQDIGRLDMRLKAMALFPYFLAARPQQGKFSKIDASPMIACLRVLTNTVYCTSFHEEKSDPGWVWVEGSESRFLLGMISAHLTSLFDTSTDTTQDSSMEQRLMTDWSGVASAAGLYMYGVLGLWAAGEPLDSRLFRRVILILARDVHQSRNEPRDSISSCLWFWRVFVGAISLAKRQLYAYEESLEGLEDCFARLIRLWSQNTNIARWEEAQVRLLRITWSTKISQHQARRVWENAIQREDASSVHESI